MGAMKICQETTGFPTSVDFSGKRIDHNPSLTAHHRLATGGFDVALIVGDDTLLTAPGPVAKALAKIPIIYIGPERNFTSRSTNSFDNCWC